MGKTENKELLSCGNHLQPFHTSGGVTRGNPIWGNIPVFGSPSEVAIRPCESVANHPIPREFFQSFTIVECLASNFSTVSMHRRFGTCAYQFFTMVTESVVHGVHKVVIRYLLV